MIVSRLLAAVPGVVHGFGTATELVPAALQAHWDLRPVKKQVHGTRAAHIVEHRQQVGEADAFHTSKPGIPVSVITADCVPLLLARRDGRAVAAVHAGWRGLYAGIIPQVLAGLDTQRGGWVAAIGPTICASCYEVSEELAADLMARFHDMPTEQVLPAPRHFDLRAVAEHQLRQGGIEDFEHVGGCTSCTRGTDGEFVFRSYRRGDRNSQQHAGLIITPERTT